MARRMRQTCGVAHDFNCSYESGSLLEHATVMATAVGAVIPIPDSTMSERCSKQYPHPSSLHKK
jgi:hypothetical protein